MGFAAVNPTYALRVTGYATSVHRLAAQVAQLVRIAHHVNRGDATVGDLKRGGLQRVVLLHRDEPRQTVDEAVAHDARHLPGKEARQPGLELDDPVGSDDRRPRSRPLV